jgi:hypothetical protein
VKIRATDRGDLDLYDGIVSLDNPRSRTIDELNPVRACVHNGLHGRTLGIDALKLRTKRGYIAKKYSQFLKRPG